MAERNIPITHTGLIKSPSMEVLNKQINDWLTDNQLHCEIKSISITYDSAHKVAYGLITYERYEWVED